MAVVEGAVVKIGVRPTFEVIVDVYEAFVTRKEEAVAADVAEPAEVEVVTGAEQDVDCGVAEAGAPRKTEGEVVDETKKELLKTGRWVEELLEDGGHDEVSRTTSYSFIESGVPASANRTV